MESKPQRTVRTQLLREWLDAQGPNSRAKLAKAVRVTEMTVYRMLNGKAPRGPIRELVCQQTGYSEDKLFPLQRKIA